jgi:S-adenosylmethionine hydrolase
VSDGPVPRVTLLTDFGTVDGYAAAMAGVVASAAPGALVEHASHDIPPGDILAAALGLFRYAGSYPDGTVHVVVVDPGVGTVRRPLAARIDGRFYVAPDNGVLTLVLQGAESVEVVALTEPGILQNASATFHGRDIFAPAAARLAEGAGLDELGSPVLDPVLLSIPQPRRLEKGARGEVLAADRFGNLITNIPAEWLGATAGAFEVIVAGQPVGPLRTTYGDVAPGQVLALVGSLGLLEISVRDGSAAVRLGVDRGAEVTTGG